jgi:hypothetical protein
MIYSLAIVFAFLSLAVADTTSLRKNSSVNKEILDDAIVQAVDDRRSELLTVVASAGVNNEEDRELLKVLCNAISGLIPQAKCTCSFNLFTLTAKFTCQVDVFKCQGTNNLVCPTGTYTGTIPLLGGGIVSKLDLTVNAPLIGPQTISFTGNHCASDPSRFCSCSASLAGTACKGCATNTCSGLQIDPDCTNVLLGAIDAIIPQCIGINV